MFSLPDQKRRRSSSFNSLSDDEEARDWKRHATDESGVGQRSSADATYGAHTGEHPPEDIKTEHERDTLDETEPPRLVGIGPFRHVKLIDCQAETQKARESFVSQIKLCSSVANPFEFIPPRRWRNFPDNATDASTTLLEMIFSMALLVRGNVRRSQDLINRAVTQRKFTTNALLCHADLLLALELGLIEGDDAGQNNDGGGATPGKSHATVDCTANQPQSAPAAPLDAEISDVREQSAENERVAEVRDESVNIMRRLSASFESVALHRTPAAPMEASPLAPPCGPRSRRAGCSVPRGGPRAPTSSLRTRAMQASANSPHSDDRSTTESSLLRMYSISGLQNAVELNNAIFEQQAVALSVGAGDTFSSLGLDQAWCRLHEAASPTAVLEARITYSELWRRANA
ncbi:hypothetical protein LTR27_011686 [Elasticomyces elasticus]|nr:hypothetical protein LTR27_011686 [Elasticomyces elasticus]